MACENELAETRVQCDEQRVLQEAKDRQLLLREHELIEQLAQDIEAKNIEIERLRGYLTVKVMDKVLFQSGSIVILPKGEAVLTRIAATLVNSQESIQVEGHTDDVPIGSILASRIPTNWELSVLRAVSVVRFLENNNIDSARMTALGHSKFKPVVDNDSEENRQRNRRVEIVLVPNQDLISD
ncbi:hypothetical protein AB835_01405 [Candidatus Endobugula sertula]|uniref:OmpA-like domain-containing protein n=1 Tax=Candidatus Endobugula sertula TaxID=62101 RepID=A0A1D2QTQ5_9GAMM|nr:hypothetical protein AB835_01405 [Candidatus Endobugula sertula]